jgi:GAF domain-containing protein
MAAFAFQDIIQNRYYVRLDSSVAQTETDHALILDAARLRTDSQTAVLYSLQPETSEVTAITARSSVAARMKGVATTFSDATSQWIESLTGSVQGNPEREPHLEKFPDVLQYRLKRLVVVPLRKEEHLLGLLTLGRSAETSFDPAAIELAQRAGRLLTAVLERDFLRKKLVERKLVERAKGILQQRRNLSEEQAYHLLRNHSRRRRMPMANLAREIIDVSLSRTLFAAGIDSHV